ncbi:LOW QUALITY PROTEIN: Lanthionine synthetase C-like [Dillenia turbinata]|uniref:Lanthionine synthetase C-like n=1 Tax=Dillenia turbinata TaxID=194707 RepID=A0AAN8Z1U6_9MAGN
MGQKSSCLLMYEWYGEKYWGAAHGLAGIMHVLMHMPLKPDQLQDLTLKYMIENRPHSGNYAASEDDRGRDVLVHSCRRAPGIALTLVKAAEIIFVFFRSFAYGFRDPKIEPHAASFCRVTVVILKAIINNSEAAADAAEVAQNRDLLKRVGLCHGISGNANGSEADTSGIDAWRLLHLLTPNVVIHPRHGFLLGPAHKSYGTNFIEHFTFTLSIGIHIL